MIEDLRWIAPPAMPLFPVRAEMVLNCDAGRKKSNSCAKVVGEDHIIQCDIEHVAYLQTRAIVKVILDYHSI